MLPSSYDDYDCGDALAKGPRHGLALLAMASWVCGFI